MTNKSTKSHPTASHWGAGVVSVENGKVTAVTGHPLDSDPSQININYIDGINSQARIRKPAVREAYLEHGRHSRSPRTAHSPFIEVDWDTALDLVAKELRHVIDNHGNQAIFAGSYGWASAGRFHHAQSQLKRFLNCLGGFVRSEGNYSYNAALVLMPYIVGNFRHHVKQATRWTTVAKHAELVVMFGGVPLRSAQVGGGGLARHQLKDVLIDCKKKGVDFINISPLRMDADSKLDPEWLPPIPGSDTAIMMGIAHTLIKEDLHDQQFLERYTIGFDKVHRYLMGESDGVAKDAEWAGQLSGIPSSTIERLAKRMATSRTLICTAVGLQRAEHGEQPLWMTVTLAAMLGQIGMPGCGYGIGYGADASIGTSDRPLKWPTFPQGNNPVSEFIPVANISELLLKPGENYDYNGEVRQYPEIKLMWWAGGNPFHHHQDINRLVKAFQQPQTIIVNEINWTATAKHADIVLPATSTLERNDFGAGSQDTALVPMPRMVNPIGEARDEYDIYCNLSKRLDVHRDFSLGRSSDEWLDSMWQEMRSTASAAGHSLPDKFQTFLASDIIEFPDPAPENVFLSEFRNDPINCPLPTSSGKLELYCDEIASFNYADCPGQATWLPPTEWLGADKSKQFPLHLISGQPLTRLHSQWDAGAYSQSRKVNGREPVLLHPNDAAKRNISDGDVVRLFNDRGSCLAGAVLSEDILPSVVFLWTGAWYDPIAEQDSTSSDNDQVPLPLDKHGNPNVLTHDLRTSRLSQGPAAHSTLIELEKYNGVAPPVTAFDAPVKTKDTSDKA